LGSILRALALDEEGLLTISRRFDNERLARRKQDEGSDLPMGARII